MPREPFSTSRQGFSLVEAILAVAVFALLATGLSGAYLYGQESTALAGQHARATLLAEEGLEAARNIRDADFTNLVDGSYGLKVADGQFWLVGEADTTDIFTRQIIVRAIDKNKKSVVVNVSWQQNPQRNALVSLESRFTNWQAASASNWASPLQSANIPLLKNFAASKIAVSGNYAYVVRDNESDGASNFFSVDISIPDEPVIVASLTLPGALTDIALADHYAYVTSRDSEREFQIIDIAEPRDPKQLADYNLSKDFLTTSVFVENNIAYVTRYIGAGDELNMLDVSEPSNPVRISQIAFKENVYDVEVSKGYAYVATGDAERELQIIDVSSPSKPERVASVDLPGESPAQSIAIAGDALFVSQASVVYGVDIANALEPSLRGSYDSGTIINDISIRLGNNNSYLYVATERKESQFKVVDVSDLSSLILLSSLSAADNEDLRGIIYDEATDRVFAVGRRDENGNEFFVFRPQ